MALLLVIRDDGAIPWATAIVFCVPIAPSITAQFVERGWPGGQEGRVFREHIRGQHPQGRDVIDDPYATAMGSQDHIFIAGMDGDITHRDRREITAFEGRPLDATVQADEQARFGAEVEQGRIHRVLLHHVGETVEIRRREGYPGLAEIAGLVDVRRHIAGAMTIEGREGCALVKGAGFNPGYPGVFRKIWNVGDDVGPAFPAVAAELHVAIIGAHPDRFRVLGTLGNGVDGAVGLGGGIIHRKATAVFLLLFLGVVGGQIATIAAQSLPGLAVIVGSEQVLSAHVERGFVGGADLQGGVPVPAELGLARAGLRLDESGFAQSQVDAPRITALALGINVIGVRGIRLHPESVAAVEILPMAILDGTTGARRTHPGAVVLETAEHAIGQGHVHGHVVVLPDGKVAHETPVGSAILGAVKAAIGACIDALWIFGVYPRGVPIAMGASADDAEGLAAIVADGHVQARLVDPHGIFRVNKKGTKIKRTDDRVGAAVAANPGFATIIGAE